jgi:hypothetical protein
VASVAANGVLVELPEANKAPGVRDGIRDLANWTLAEVADGFGLVAPAEGAGTVYPYFKAVKLCDAATTLTAATWEPVVAAAGGAHEGEAMRTAPGAAPDPNWQNYLMKWGNKVGATGRPGAHLVAISTAIAALRGEQLPNYLQKHVPKLFKENPDASLWLFEVDPLFLRRMALMRVLLALKTIPDFLDATKGKAPQIRTLQEHTLTGGTRTEALVAAVLTAIPPTALGFPFSRMPHVLVYLFGHPTPILEPQPPSFASLYAPSLHGAEVGFHWKDSAFFEGVGPAEIQTLLQWWVTRLNVIYSYALDPSNFDDGHGCFDIKAQTVWLLTFERLLGDALAIASSPQGPAIARVETAFDLLDKAESLLGFTQKKNKSGKGAKRLLNRSEMVKRLDHIWDERLPLQLRPRFKKHGKFLYDRVYDHIRQHAYDFRVAQNGIKLWSSDSNELVHWTWDAFVPALVRAVRNSAHGLMEVFDKPSERDVVVAHDGEMPPDFPQLAAFIAFALVADAERLCDGTWLDAA